MELINTLTDARQAEERTSTCSVATTATPLSIVRSWEEACASSDHWRQWWQSGKPRPLKHSLVVAEAATTAAIADVTATQAATNTDSDSASMPDSTTTNNSNNDNRRSNINNSNRSNSNRNIVNRNNKTRKKLGHQRSGPHSPTPGALPTPPTAQHNPHSSRSQRDVRGGGRPRCDYCSCHEPTSEDCYGKKGF